jgi:hypothetical protein
MGIDQPGFASAKVSTSDFRDFGTLVRLRFAGQSQYPCLSCIYKVNAQSYEAYVSWLSDELTEGMLTSGACIRTCSHALVVPLCAVP